MSYFKTDQLLAVLLAFIATASITALCGVVFLELRDWIASGRKRRKVDRK